MCQLEEAIKKAAEERIGARYKDLICKLETSIGKARLSNDKLSQQLFVLNNRTINVAQKIGFSTFDDLEEAILDEPEVWKADSIKANRARAESSANAQVQQQNRSPYDSPAFERIREEFDQLKRQVCMLQQQSVGTASHTPAIDSTGLSTTTRSPLSPLKSVGNSTPSEESTLRIQLNILSRKYDALVAAKESAESKYKQDYRKWKEFKSWLLNKSKHAKVLRAQLENGNFDLGDELQEDEGNHGCELPATPTRQNPTRSLSVNEENVFPLLSPSRLSHALCDSNMHSTRHRPPHALKTAKSGKLLSASRSDSPSPKVKIRKELHSEPRNILRSEVAEDVGDAPASSKTSSASSKGKGRYTARASTGEAINALYEINTSRNDGLAFQYDEVVRSKEHRQRLDAGDCDCCKEYYDAVAPLPSRLAPPAWDSSPIADAKHLQDEVTASHKKQISRHRHQWSPAKTPPDYWNIGFPTTQEAADINRRAAEMHANKRRRVEREAKTEGGRYIKRRDRSE